MSNDLERHLDELLRHDEQAFEAVYQGTRYSVFAAIKAIVKDRAATEDLMQETYLRMIEKLDGYRRGSNFNAWLTQIAKNLAYDHLRKTKHEIRLNPDDRPDLFDRPVATAEPTIDFDGLLAELPETERLVVMLRAVGGQSFATIAKTTGSSVGTVHAMYQKTIAILARRAKERS